MRALAVAGLVALLPAAALAQPRPLSPELQVNVSSIPVRTRASAAAQPDGSFLVVWGSESAHAAIRGRRLDGKGAPLGDEFRVSSAGYEPAVAMDAEGDFVVVWSGFYGVYGQLLDRTGAPVDEGFTVSFGLVSRFDPHDVAMARGGEFVVVRLSYQMRIIATRFDAAGHQLGADLVHDLAGDYTDIPAVAARADGGFVVVWTRNSGWANRVLGRRYSGQGQPIGEAFEVSTDRPANKGDPEVAATPDGSFVVVWRADDQDGDAGGIFGQRYDAAGRTAGGEFRINAHTTGSQLDPAVAMDADGSFFVTWASDGQDGSGLGVFGQAFDAAGRRVGAEIQLNQSSTGDQLRPSAARARGGPLLAVWEGVIDGAPTPDLVGRLFSGAGGSGGAGNGDRDGDGVPDAVDNCPTVPNPDQADVAADGWGDACVSPDVLIPPSARIGANPVIGEGTVIGPGASVGDDASIGRFVQLGARATVGRRATLGDFALIAAAVTLGDDVSVAAEARIERGAWIGDEVTIGGGADLGRNVVVGRGATIEPLAVVSVGARIGRGARIEMGARVGRRATVAPGAVVPAGTSVPPGTMFP